MPTFSPQSLAQWSGGQWAGLPNAPVTGFCIDSRQVRPGQLFVALKTDKRDGHDFLEAARASGAAAALVSRHDSSVGLAQLVVADPLAAFQAVAREHRKLFFGPVVGVTGSAGKTSTKELIALLLGSGTNPILATSGNLNNHIGVPLTLTNLDAATHKAAVVEAGISAPGDMEVLARMIEPDIAVTTLIGPAHLQELGGLEGVAREKAVLSQHLRKAGLAVFTAATEHYLPFKSLHGATLVLENGVMPDGERCDPARAFYTCRHDGLSTRLVVEFCRYPAITAVFPRVSEGMASNAALAICVATRLGVRAEDIVKRIKAWQPAAMRGEWRTLEGRSVYLDCYNANPASMADALEAFRAQAPAEQPRFYVIGCMEELGERATEYHLELGRSLKLRPEDQAVIIGEQAPSVVKGALEAGLGKHQVGVAAGAEHLCERIAQFSGSVFLKGSRRHQLEKALGGELAHASHA